jgi:hypothetical protein
MAASGDGHSVAVSMGFKHIKSKDNQKDLVCHLIGIMGLLSGTFRATVIQKMIKKDKDDLKSYFQELGFNYDAVKEEGQDDYIVKYNNALGRLAEVKPV